MARTAYSYQKVITKLTTIDYLHHGELITRYQVAARISEHREQKVDTAIGYLPIGNRYLTEQAITEDNPGLEVVVIRLHELIKKI